MALRCSGSEFNGWNCVFLIPHIRVHLLEIMSIGINSSDNAADTFQIVCSVDTTFCHRLRRLITTTAEQMNKNPIRYMRHGISKDGTNAKL